VTKIKKNVFYIYAVQHAQYNATRKNWYRSKIEVRPPRYRVLTLTYDLDFQSQASCGHDPHTIKNGGGLGSLKVTGNSAIRYSAYEFLLVFHIITMSLSCTV